jgi:hypothetical protein
MSTEVDALAEAARSVQNKVGEQNLWRAVMKLRVWYFIAQGEGDQAEPMVASVEGRPQLLAFTDEDRAEAFTRHLESKKGGPRAGLLEMDVPDAVEYAKELESLDVETILFNNGEYGFSCSMTKLKDMHSRYAPRM